MTKKKKILSFTFGIMTISVKKVKWFFEQTGSEPKDLVAWMKDVKDFHFPCMVSYCNGKYLKEYCIYETSRGNYNGITLDLKGVYDFWDYIRAEENIKKFNQFCKFIKKAYEEE